MSNLEHVEKLIKDHKVEFVDLRFADMRGVQHHVTFPKSIVDASLFEDGKMFDGSSISGWRGIHQSDMVLLPDPSTAFLDPFTADPTLAMKAAVLGRRFQIRWGGSTDLIYTEDVARAFLAAAAARLDGARVYNLHGASASVADVVHAIGAAWPPAKELITHVEQALPFPAALDDARYQKDLDPAPSTSLAAGVQKTLDEFERLRQSGRLDARELT